MNLAPDKTPHSATTVNWQDPDLQALLSKSENWRFDNRGGHTEQDVHVYLGWSGTVAHEAKLVWEKDQAVVLVTDFPIGPGEQVRLERPLGDRTRTLWGQMVEGREGNREEDKQKGLLVYWLRVS